jgi:hypothetical protein
MRMKSRPVVQAHRASRASCATACLATGRSITPPPTPAAHRFALFVVVHVIYRGV